jgi:ADP-heptose:LPS heptosyltransferase
LPARVPEAFKHPERILLVRTDRLGDVVLTLPMLPVLRAAFPRAHIAMLLTKYTGEIVKGNPYVDELIWYGDEGDVVPFRTMVQEIRKRRFDAVIVARPTPRLAWLMYRAGIPLRIGTGYRYYSVLFNRRVYEHRSDAKRHEVEYNLNLLKELSCSVETSPQFLITIPPEAEQAVNARLRLLGATPGKDMAILHPGSGGHARDWSAGNFGRLAERLARERGLQVCVTGGKGEEQIVAEVVRTSRDKAVSLAGTLSLKELAALIRDARVFVSNSTGPLHIAVAVGTPVVGMYPRQLAMSATRWGPYTDRKRVLTPQGPDDCAACDGRRGEPCTCMDKITVEEVYQAIVDVLSEGQNHREKLVTHA